jgi:transcriptional regulator with GAF, ATPase, and Fis domain
MIDATKDLQALAQLASDPRALGDVLDRALLALSDVLPYDLAAVLELEGAHLKVRAARGRLADEAVRRHHLDLARYPTIRRALELRRPIALTHEHHASEEGDPYDDVLDLPEGHACMVVPLFAGDRDLGVITLDRSICVPYDTQAVHLAGVYGQIVALAIVYAEQARALDLHRRQVEEHNRLLAQEAGRGGAEERLGQSADATTQRVVRMARQVAVTDTPVLILGETGVGKEVLAQAIHDWSPRRDRPFVKMNCAAIPETLVESELFGHVRGAFTGAQTARQGRFLTADGGTLLLDEIGDLPLDVQAKLLRVLQSGTFEPVGSDRPIQVDVRILAATHVNLQEAVAQGRFREDLYYRLDVFPLSLPPLRHRLIDLPDIARSVLNELAQRTGRGPWTLPQDTLATLTAQDWPGNIRQLRNALERATILRPIGALRPEDFALPRRVMQRGSASPLETLDGVMRAHIMAVLRHTNGRLYGEDGAAHILGLKPSTLQSRMKKLGVDRKAAVSSA